MSILKYIKQNSAKKRALTDRHVKNSSRFVMYSEIKQFLTLIGYNRVQKNFFNKLIEEFKNSSFVKSYNDEGIVLQEQKYIFKKNHHIYSTILLKPGSKYDSFTFSKFIKFSAEFLYGIPQATEVSKGISSSVQPTGQTSVAKYLKLSQSRIQQIHKLSRKVYVYAEIDKHTKDQCNYFGKSYTREVQKLGYKKDGSFKPNRIFKLVGTKLMCTLNFKSYVRGCTKKSNKIQHRKLPGLANSNKGDYKKSKLLTPKQHSKIDKQGLLVGFKTNYMRNNDVTRKIASSDSSYQKNKVKTFQIVAYNKESSIRKLDVQVRIDSIYKDINDFKIENKIYDYVDFYGHSFDKRINLAGSSIASLYYKGYDTGYLRKNFNLLMFYTNKEVSKYITYKQNRSKYSVHLNDKGETEYTLRTAETTEIEDKTEDCNYINDYDDDCPFLKINRIKHTI